MKTHSQFTAELRKLVAAAGGQTAFATLLGTTKQRVYEYSTGRKKPPKWFLDAIGWKAEIMYERK